MNIAICDDDKSFRDLLEKHLRNYLTIEIYRLIFFNFLLVKNYLKINYCLIWFFWMLKWVILMELIQVKN